MFTVFHGITWKEYLATHIVFTLNQQKEKKRTNNEYRTDTRFRYIVSLFNHVVQSVDDIYILEQTNKKRADEKVIKIKRKPDVVCKKIFHPVFDLITHLTIEFFFFLSLNTRNVCRFLNYLFFGGRKLTVKTQLQWWIQLWTELVTWSICKHFDLFFIYRIYVETHTLRWPKKIFTFFSKWMIKQNLNDPPVECSLE